MSTTLEPSVSSQDQPGSASSSPNTVRQTAVFELTISTNTSTSPQTLRRTARTKARPVSMRSKENVLESSSEDFLSPKTTTNNTLTESTSSLDRTLSSSTNSLDSQNDTQLISPTNSHPDSQTTQTTILTSSNETTSAPKESPSITASSEEITPSIIITPDNSQSTTIEPASEPSPSQTPTTQPVSSSSSTTNDDSTKTQPVAIPASEDDKPKERQGSFFMASSPSKTVTEEKPRRGTFHMSRSWSEEKAMSPSSSPSSNPSTPSNNTTPSSSPSTTTGLRPSGGKKTETGTLRFGGFLRSSKSRDRDSGSNNTSANNSLSEEHDALNDNTLSSSPSNSETKPKKRNNDTLRSSSGSKGSEDEGTSTPAKEKRSLWRRTIRKGRSSESPTPSPGTSPSTKTLERTTSTESYASNTSDTDIRPASSDDMYNSNNSYENLKLEDMDFSTLEVEIPEAAVASPNTLKLIEDYLNNHTVNVGALSKDELSAIQKSPVKPNSTVTSAEVEAFRRQQLDRYEKDVASQKDAKQKNEKDSWRDKFKFSKSSSKMETPPSLPKQKELLEASIQTTAQENEVMRRKIQELKLFVDFLTTEKNALNGMTHRLDRLERSGRIHTISLPNSQVPSTVNSTVNSKANSPSTSPTPSPGVLSPISSSQTI